MIICSDGGANRFKKFIDKVLLQNQKKLPDYIVGDMDSISERNKIFYTNQKVRFFKIDDQNQTELERCINLATASKKLKRILCHGALGGRIDQTMATINTLHHLSSHKKVSEMDQIIMMDKFSKMIYLHPGVQYLLQMSKEIDLFYGVGLVPIPGQFSLKDGDKDRVETKGLQWNLGLKYNTAKLEWGSVISTSNHIKNEKFQVSVLSQSVPLVFSTSLKYGEMEED